MLESAIKRVFYKALYYMETSVRFFLPHDEIYRRKIFISKEK